jgi:hypothetical protein
MITIPLADYQREQSRRRIFQRALVDVAHRLNQMADELEREQFGPWIAADDADTEPAAASAAAFQPATRGL